MSRDIALTRPAQRSVRTGPGLTAQKLILCLPYWPASDSVRFWPAALAAPGQMLDHAAGRGAGIVDHDVAAAERLVGLLDEVLGVLVLAQVGGDRHDLAAGRLGDLLRDGIERFLAARADRDIDAFFCERQRDALADAFAAAGHQRGLSFELEIHAAPLRFVGRLFRLVREPAAALGFGE